MAENDAGDWAYLKFTCDNKTECSYVYEGVLINECESGYIADYMLIYYSCSPGENCFICKHSFLFTAYNFL